MSKMQQLASPLDGLPTNKTIEQIREDYHGYVWHYNPYSGAKRREEDMQSDPYGKLIVSDGMKFEPATIRKFDTGATRDVDTDKLDYEGFLSPLVLERYAQYMHKHRKQANGTLRNADNWQKGIPAEVYAKSAWRHFFDFWKEHRGIETKEGLEDALCALLFNVMGYLHVRLLRRPMNNVDTGYSYAPNEVWNFEYKEGHRNAK